MCKKLAVLKTILFGFSWKFLATCNSRRQSFWFDSCSVLLPSFGENFMIHLFIMLTSASMEHLLATELLNSNRNLPIGFMAKSKLRLKFSKWKWKAWSKSSSSSMIFICIKPNFVTRPKLPLGNSLNYSTQFKIQAMAKHLWCRTVFYAVCPYR